MSRVAFYGGSFNPPHVGHQSTVLYALETANVDRIHVAPVFKHPYGKVLAPYDHRLEMCHLMVKPFWRNVIVDTIEELAWVEGGRGITSETLKVFRKHDLRYNDTIVLVIGSDLKEDIKTWEGYDFLKEEYDAGRLDFFCVERAVNMSSTVVRETIKKGESCQRFVPRRVLKYIEEHKLYL